MEYQNWADFKELKSRTLTFQTNLIYLPQLNPFKNNAFYFILKTLFVLKMFKFLSYRFGHVEKTAWSEI